jgi:glutathione synthase/RimK-type ligase-like ATP-grasp enzyme
VRKAASTEAALPLPQGQGDAMKIVIVAFENDNHTAPLKWALEQAGYRVACWGGLSWTEEQQVSISFDRGIRLALGSCSVEAGDVIWIRRTSPPQPNPNVAEPDKNFAEGEYRWFSLSTLYLLECLPARCINKYSASRLINNKSVQLLLAKSCGMNVPATLMSNSPAAVKAFLQDTSRRMVSKSFFPHIWRKEGSEALAVTETFEITADTLPEDEVLTYAPSIYQEMVVKNLDVRMVLMGTAVYSYALSNPKGSLDWRQDVGQGLITVESIATPAEVESAVLAFAGKAGISFGSFDFAVDATGAWWFLEVNEEGQFLWLDEFNPSARIQEKFLSFLTLPEGSSKEAIEQQQTLFPSWKDYCEAPARKQVAPERNPGAPIVSIER